jgi:hypothetical protein
VALLGAQDKALISDFPGQYRRNESLTGQVVAHEVSEDSSGGAQGAQAHVGCAEARRVGGVVVLLLL